MKDEKNSFAYRMPPAVSRLSSPDLKLTVQFASGDDNAPSRAQIRRWIGAELKTDAEVTVRFVDSAEAQQLNRDYRGRDNATNVLSFLYEAGPPLHGDIALCFSLARKEAKELGISAQARTAHLLVHAVLHLQGYDHEDEGEAQAMETRESKIVTALGFPDPYSTLAVSHCASSFFHSGSSGFASDPEHAFNGPGLHFGPN